MRIARPTDADAADWVRLRAALWPDSQTAEHVEEASTLLAGRSDDAPVFVARDGETVVGFAEAAMRRDYVNGCDTSPVAFLEGIYVRPEFRRRGVARALCDAVAAWGRAAGACEFASDAAIDNEGSIALHRALGFAETERVVFFRRVLSDV